LRVKTEERRQAIVQAAAKVFQEKGFSGASMSEVAARLGGSKATLYGYFPSKDELFVAVLEDGIRRDVAEVFDRLEGTKPFKDRLSEFVLAFMRLVAKPATVSLRRLIVSEAERSGLGKMVHEIGPGVFWAQAGEIFAADMERGSLKRADPSRLVRTLVALCLGPPISMRMEGVIDDIADADLKAAAAEAVYVFMKAYGPDA